MPCIMLNVYQCFKAKIGLRLQDRLISEECEKWYSCAVGIVLLRTQATELVGMPRGEVRGTGEVKVGYSLE
jgi:hypothetical protein